MPEYYIVTNADGLLTHSQMSTISATRRKMSNGEGFTVYQTKLMNGNQTWGRLSEDPGGLQQEYVCLQIGNREFAKKQPLSEPIPSTTLLEWAQSADTWMRLNGFKGPKPS